MQIGFTPEQQALRLELRAYFAEMMTPEVDAEVSVGETGGPHCLAAVRKMGRDGWLGIGWPKEYGGQGRGPLEQFIFYDESWRARAPVPALTINTVARTLMEFGTPEQREFFLPQILRGECHFSIGYTEPGAGTLRQRVLLRGLPRARRDHRLGGGAPARVAGRGLERAHRARLPGYAVLDVRRRDQRGAARPDRALWARHAARAADVRRGRAWTSS